MKSATVNTVKRLLLILAGSVLMSFTVNTFVKAGGLVPAGFTGLVLLLQEICLRFGGFKIPFSPVYYALNIVPAAVCFKYIGKKFTLYSVLMVLLTGILIDGMPTMFIGIIQLHDTLLSAVFGGLLYAVSISLCLYAGATSGGTDFIAIFIAERFRKDAWNQIFMGNCVILAIAGFLFDLDKALYSIIFQYVTTVALGALYKNYQQRTLLIITNVPEQIYTVINEITNHGATCFNGYGSFEKKERTMVYSIVRASQVKKLVPAIRKVDPLVFINVLKTELIHGKFYMQPKD